MIKPLTFTQELLAYRDEHQCSIQEAKRVVEKRRLIADAMAATTFDELKLIVLRVIEKTA